MASTAFSFVRAWQTGHPRAGRRERFCLFPWSSQNCTLAPSVKTMANNLSDYLAAERTFLAWIRTGLALAGFGFVIARFGLFLRAIRLDEGASGPGPVGSPGFGAALILAGSLALGWSARSYTQLIRNLKRGESEPSHGTLLRGSNRGAVGRAWNCARDSLTFGQRCCHAAYSGDIDVV